MLKNSWAVFYHISESDC